MKALVFAAVLSAIVAGGALAQSGKPAPKAPPKEIACAVMKDHKVNIAEATGKKMFADHKGSRYFFCCAGCPGAFKKDPAKFAKAPHIPTPKS